MLKTGSYITAAKTSEVETYEGANSWVLFTYEGRGYIGRVVSSIMTEDYEFIEVTEKTLEVCDDDASHLYLSEYEGVFEMRCMDMENEIRSLMIDLY